MSELWSEASVTSAAQYFRGFERVMERMPLAEIDQTAAELVRAYEENRSVFLFGNGGSAALASHFACDLGKGTIAESSQKRFRVLAFTDNVALMTAWANDSSFDNVFAEQLRNFVQPGDIAFAISASGNSPNVLKALEVGSEAGAINIGLTGFQGGKMKALCNFCMVIHSDNMQIIEDLQLSVAHAVFSVVKHRIANGKCSARAAGVSSSD